VPKSADSRCRVGSEFAFSACSFKPEFQGIKFDFMMADGYHYLIIGTGFLKMLIRVEKKRVDLKMLGRHINERSSFCFENQHNTGD